MPKDKIKASHINHMQYIMAYNVITKFQYKSQIKPLTFNDKFRTIQLENETVIRNNIYYLSGLLPCS